MAKNVDNFFRNFRQNEENGEKINGENDKICENDKKSKRKSFRNFRHNGKNGEKIDGKNGKNGEKSMEKIEKKINKWQMTMSPHILKFRTYCQAFDKIMAVQKVMWN